MAMHATWDPEKRQRAFMAPGRPNLRFQELRDEVGMTERWTHRGRSGPGRPSSTWLLRWHIG
jgi:hypothetical protein